MPNGGPHDVYAVHCPHCGKQNLFGIPEHYSNESTGGTDFICPACGQPVLTLWDYLHTTFRFDPVEQTGFICPDCGTWYAVDTYPGYTYCLNCGKKLRGD